MEEPDRFSREIFYHYVYTYVMPEFLIDHSDIRYVGKLIHRYSGEIFHIKDYPEYTQEQLNEIINKLKYLRFKSATIPIPLSVKGILFFRDIDDEPSPYLILPHYVKMVSIHGNFPNSVKLHTGVILFDRSSDTVSDIDFLLNLINLHYLSCAINQIRDFNNFINLQSVKLDIRYAIGNQSSIDTSCMPQTLKYLLLYNSNSNQVSHREFSILGLNTLDLDTFCISKINCNKLIIQYITTCKNLSINNYYNSEISGLIITESLVYAKLINDCNIFDDIAKKVIGLEIDNISITNFSNYDNLTLFIVHALEKILFPRNLLSLKATYNSNERIICDLSPCDKLIGADIRGSCTIIIPHDNIKWLYVGSYSHIPRIPQQLRLLMYLDIANEEIIKLQYLSIVIIKSFRQFYNIGEIIPLSEDIALHLRFIGEENEKDLVLSVLQNFTNLYKLVHINRPWHFIL